MVWVGRTIAGIGVLLVALPIVAFPLSLLGVELPLVTQYAPTFILGGIFVFVIGMAIRTVLKR